MRMVALEEKVKNSKIIFFPFHLKSLVSEDEIIISIKKGNKNI